MPNKENNNPVQITELVLRDGHQSLFATRMRIDDMLPIAEKLDKIGFAFGAIASLVALF